MLLARLVATVVRPISSAVATTRRMSHAIALSPSETTFVALLDDFANHLSPPVECRIAGGWVRDKVRRPPHIPCSCISSCPCPPQTSISPSPFPQAIHLPWLLSTFSRRKMCPLAQSARSSPIRSKVNISRPAQPGLWASNATLLGFEVKPMQTAASRKW